MIKKKLGTLGIALIPLGIGLFVGLAVPIDFIRNQVAGSLDETQIDNGHQHDMADDHVGESEHVELSPKSQESMGLRTGLIKLSEYQSHFELPAFVREVPGASELHVATRFSGLVKRVFISQGQTVTPGQPIAEIELTGELLASAQSELLDAQKQISIVEKEIARLEPSVKAGGVASKTLLEKKYERDRLIAKVETKSQELLVRGLNQSQIDEIIETKKLLRTVRVNVPDNLIPPQLNAGGLMDNAPENFLVERLVAKPGMMINMGEHLCLLSFHAVVALEGQAYEKDLPFIRNAISEQTPLVVSVGPEGAVERIPGQHISFLSNHVDAETNTYPFFIYLINKKLYQTKYGTDQADFIAWKWKPGQRAHVEMPAEKFSEAVVIPRDALAVDGLNHYVFRWNGVVEHDHDHDHSDADHEEHELLDEFEAIAVSVAYMDRNRVLIELDEPLKKGDRIAFNNASRLLFAMQSGGAGHTHHHDH